MKKYIACADDIEPTLTQVVEAKINLLFVQTPIWSSVSDFDELQERAQRKIQNKYEKLIKELDQELKKLEQSYKHVSTQIIDRLDDLKQLSKDFKMRQAIIADIPQCIDRNVLDIYLSAWSMAPFLPAQ